MENEFKGLLDREKHIQDAKKIFSGHIDALIDIVNYGSWLIPRAYGSSKKGWTDIITIGVLLKQVVVMVDCIEVLAINAIALPGFLQARAAFEASLYIDWILTRDGENKAKYYYVSNLRNIRSWALRMTEGTPQQEKFETDVQELNSYVNFKKPDVQETARKQLEDVNHVLAQKDLKVIDSDLEKHKRGNVEPNWYMPILNSNSLRQVANSVNRIPEYIFFYEKGSKVTHSASYTDHIQFEKDKSIIFEPIRNLNDMPTLINYAMGTAIHTYRVIVTRYRPGELKDFRDKYIKDWRKYYLDIPVITYKFEKKASS